MSAPAPARAADAARVRCAPVVGVCGLHGGAGTSTTAALLAQAAARLSHPADVVLADADPGSGGLALHLQAASPDSLHTLASDPDAVHRWTDHHGVRLLAPAPQRAPAGEAEAIALALAELGAVHKLIVLDLGALGSPHAQRLLAHADLVLWSIDATTHAGAAQLTLASPLARGAHGVAWALAAHNTGRAGRQPPATELSALIPDLRGLVLIPRMAELPSVDPAREQAGRHLLDLLQ